MFMVGFNFWFVYLFFSGLFIFFLVCLFFYVFFFAKQGTALSNLKF